MWLALLPLFPAVFVSVISCGRQKKYPKSKKDSVSSESGRREPAKPAEDKRQGSDVEQKQSSNSGTTAPSVSTPALKTEQTQQTPITAAKASEDRLKQTKFQVEPTQESTRSRKSKKESAKMKKTSKEKQSAEKAAAENPGSSADDSDTFKHVMSIRDVVKKEKAMKQKAK